MRWRTHLEEPATGDVFTALIVVCAEDGTLFLSGTIWNWKHGEWLDENDKAHKLTDNEYWWIPEEEVVATIERDRQRGGRAGA